MPLRDVPRRQARAEHAGDQPTKLAAIEGRYDTEKPTPLTLFGIPDDKAATIATRVEIPWLGSLILTHTWDGAIRGLKEWPAADRPPVAFPFFGFRIMVGIAFVMLGVVVLAGWLLHFKRRLYDAGWYLLSASGLHPSASSPCSQVGSPRRSAASPGRSTA